MVHTMQSFIHSFIYFSFIWLSSSSSENPRDVNCNATTEFIEILLCILHYTDRNRFGIGVACFSFVSFSFLCAHFPCFKGKIRHCLYHIEYHIRYGLRENDDKKHAAADLDATQFLRTSFICAKDERMIERINDKNNIQRYVIFMLGMVKQRRSTIWNWMDLLYTHSTYVGNFKQWKKERERAKMQEKCTQSNQLCCRYQKKTPQEKAWNVPSLETCILFYTHSFCMSRGKFSNNWLHHFIWQRRQQRRALSSEHFAFQKEWIRKERK